MKISRTLRPWLILVTVLVLIYAGYVTIVALNQRSLLYFPTHQTAETPLTPWIVQNNLIGYARIVDHPRTIWLMTHGNGGQADGRAYVLSHLAKTDSLYILEYPGYGLRAGTPTKASINQAAAEAYSILRAEAGASPVGVVGESLGSGAASYLATLPRPPDKVVLVVPFDTLASVAAEHMPLIPARWLLQDDWDNVTALQAYTGPIDIYGAINDGVIGFAHARNLAAHLKQARFIEIPGGHNDWSASDLVRIER